MTDLGLVSYSDLEARWRPPCATPKERRKWLLRKVRALDLRPAIPGRGNEVRFRLASVLSAEERCEQRRAVLQ